MDICIHYFFPRAIIAFLWWKQVSVHLWSDWPWCSVSSPESCDSALFLCKTKKILWQLCCYLGWHFVMSYDLNNWILTFLPYTHSEMFEFCTQHYVIDILYNLLYDPPTAPPCAVFIKSSPIKGSFIEILWSSWSCPGPMSRSSPVSRLKRRS